MTGVQTCALPICCPITNIYGTREVGHIAMRCPEGSFHVNEEYLLVEQENNGSSSSLEAGELLLTTLDTSVMPFLRYRIGDFGKLSRKVCTCGRSLLVLDEILGRTGEIFHTRDGRMLSPNFWCRAFMNKGLNGNINRFQIVYKSDNEIQIKIVQADTYSKDSEDELLRFLKKNFHQSMNIYLTYVNEIKQSTSGKYQMIINETCK